MLFCDGPDSDRASATSRPAGLRPVRRTRQPLQTRALLSRDLQGVLPVMIRPPNQFQRLNHYLRINTMRGEALSCQWPLMSVGPRPPPRMVSCSIVARPRRRDIASRAGGLLQILREDRPVLSQHVAEMKGGLGRVPISIDQREQEFQGSRVAPHGFVGEPTKHHFKDRHPARLAVFGYGDLLSNDGLQDCPDRPAAFRTSLGIAALACHKLRRLRRSPIADCQSALNFDP
jgi:hypothetical protein